MFDSRTNKDWFLIIGQFLLASGQLLQVREVERRALFGPGSERRRLVSQIGRRYEFIAKLHSTTLTLVDVYSSLIYVHILSALTFMLTHGVTASAILFVRNETNAERIRLLLQIARNRTVVGVSNSSITVLLLTGITLGFLGDWWNRLWIWAALGIAVAITFAMAFLGRLYFERLRKVVGLTYEEGRKKHEPIPEASEEEILRISSKSPAYSTAMVGLLGLLAILYLMIFKPF